LRIKNCHGFGLLEAIIAVSILVIIASTATATTLHTLTANNFYNDYEKANFMAQEGLEAVRSIRNQAWSNLDIGSVSCPASINKGVETVSNSWQFKSAPDVFGKFSRTLTITNVCRDVSGNIDISSGTYDENTKKITSTVSWNLSPSRQDNVVLNAYLTRFNKDVPPTPTENPTPTPTSTSTPTPTPTPTPVLINSCEDYCRNVENKNYGEGHCRIDPVVCFIFGESYESGGDQYCPTWLWFQDTCCCDN